MKRTNEGNNVIPDCQESFPYLSLFGSLIKSEGMPVLITPSSLDCPFYWGNPEKRWVTD